MEFERVLAAEIRRIRERLRELTALAFPPRERRRKIPRKAPAKSIRRSKPVSAAQKKARIVQGRYLGAVRRLKPAQRAAIKKVRAEKGVTVAIAEAKRLAK